MKYFSGILTAFILIIQFSFAQIPQTISYQGMLTDSEGQMVDDGAYQITFKIYDQATEGNMLWEEIQNVSISEGIFNVILGETNPLNITFSHSCWLGITISSGDELQPRIELTASPYSLNSQQVLGTNIIPANGSVGIGTVDPEDKLVVVGTIHSTTGGFKFPDGSVQTTATSNSGEGDITAVNAGTGLSGGAASGDATLNVNGGNGISVTVDTVALNTDYTDTRYVNENQANSISAAMISPNILCSLDGVSNDGGDVDLIAGSNVTITPNDGANTITIAAAAGAGDNLGNHTATQNINLNGNYLSGDGGSEGLFINPAGRIGIGVSSPATHLHVHGLPIESRGQLSISAPLGEDSFISFYEGSNFKSYLWYDDSDDDLRLQNYNEANGGDLNLNPYGGNVGIGILNPANTLDVFGRMVIGENYAGSAAAPDNGLLVEGNVGIGAMYPSAKLEVVSNDINAGRFESDLLNSNTRVISARYTGSGNYNGIAIYGQSTPADDYGIGGSFYGGYKGIEGSVWPYQTDGDATYVGVQGYVEGNANDGTAYGVHATASIGGTNYGVYASTTRYADYNYAIYGRSNNATTEAWAGYFDGNVNVTGTVSKGGGSFKIDHPLDPTNKNLYHSFVESPDMMNIYNGNIITDGNGDAVVELPEWFEALNRDFRYQLTVIGGFAQAIISEEISNNQFSIKTDQPNIKVSWQVTGIRQDAYANAKRIPVEEMKKAHEQGRYLHPEAFGVSENMGVGYEEQQKIMLETQSKMRKDHRKMEESSLNQIIDR